MASFYTTNENWEQGEELPLLDMGEGTTPMAGKSLDQFFNAENHHLIYVYDFLAPAPSLLNSWKLERETAHYALS